MMPSPYSSRGSIDDSIDLSQRLGIKTIEKPISEPFMRYGMNWVCLSPPPETVRGRSNSQSRICNRVYAETF